MPSEDKVTCAGCGKTYVPSDGGRYDYALRGFLCPKCVEMTDSLLTPEDKALVQAVGASDPSPSIGWTIVKAAVGGLFFAVAFEMESLLEILLAQLHALVFFLWAVWPWARLALRRERAKTALEKALESGRTQMKVMPGIQPETRFCPHCGSPAKGRFCEHCGSPLPR